MKPVANAVPPGGAPAAWVWTDVEPVALFGADCPDALKALAAIQGAGR
jgi:hypothetical protein